ncbi:hypothetical protein FS749_001989 [Ceratobasidium sp. UAMH 11750]|nr:hypothetical protein FS749_001989 [Ceratobasidium sp. UAMH 11750]
MAEGRKGHAYIHGTMAGQAPTDVANPPSTARISANLANQLTISLNKPNTDSSLPTHSQYLNAQPAENHQPTSPRDKPPRASPPAPDPPRTAPAHAKQNPQHSKGSSLKAKAQSSIPIQYEKYSTHTNLPTVLETKHVALDISALDLRTLVLESMGLKNSEAKHLAYTLTGVENGYPSKSLVDLGDFERALEELHTRIRKARSREKGLKIVNTDPVAKASEVTKAAERSKRQEKSDKKKAQSKAQVEIMTKEEEFLVELEKLKPCAASICGGVTCYVCPRTAVHIPLTHERRYFWAQCYARDPIKHNMQRPPNFGPFDPSKIPNTRTPRKHIKSEPKPTIKDEKIPVKLEGDSAAFPIYLDIDDPLPHKADPTPHQDRKPDTYIEILSDSDSDDSQSISVLGSVASNFNQSTRHPIAGPSSL